MSTPSLRDQLIAKLDGLTDEQLADLLEHIEVMRYARIMKSTTLPDDYRIEDDGLVGFLTGTTDLAEHVEEILYGEPESQEDAPVKEAK